MKTIAKVMTFTSPEETLNFLEKREIRSKRIRNMCIFELDTEEELYQEIETFLVGLKADTPGRNAYSILFRKVYTEEERLNAAYLTVYSSFNCLEPVNAETVLTGACYLGAWRPTDHSPLFRFNDSIPHYRHWVQTEPFIVNTRVNWRPTRCFGGCQLFFYPIFCNDGAKKLILSAGLQGASFKSVLCQKTAEPMADLWQLWPQEVEDFLRAGPYTEEHVCGLCGRRYLTRMRGDAELYIYPKAIPEGLDFFQSAPILGAEKCIPVYVVTQRAYRVLREANIIRSLIFTPLTQSNR